MAAAVPIDGDQENSEPLKYKTWVLRVSIHCEGCKRKVKRILHSVEGVYTIDVDTRQHRVIVTGNVDSSTLIRKLEKSGKHAELWPDFQKLPNKNEEQIYQQQQQQQDNQTQNQNPNVEGDPQNNNNNNEPQQQQPQQQQQQGKEVRFEGNIPATGESQKPSANGGGNGGGGGGGGGGSKKKKKKKGHNSNNTNTSATTNNNGGSPPPGGNVVEVARVEQGGGNVVVGPPSSEPPPQQQNPGPNPNPSPENMSPPRQQPNCRVYEYPPVPYYAPPPPPVYAMSYNTAYPSSSYSASYYSAPTPYSYAYVHHGGDVEAPAPLDWNPHAVPPSDSFEIFSDENPNACSLM